MVHEVVVVGGGIGGLTVAALLAARGVDVCLLERGSQLGGVVAAVEGFGYTFDPGVGIYPCWERGEIHDQVFAELPVAPPQVRLDVPAYVVRLPDGVDVPVVSEDEQFFSALLKAFPECADQAIEFYRKCAAVSEGLRSGSRPRTTQTIFQYLANTSASFRQFIDSQLQLLTQSSSATCDLERGANALTVPRRGTFSIEGGAAALANRLADAIKRSGGRVRLDTPVLRLAYDSDGRAKGVDLLSGETVDASRAIISNLTVWDTFGKLVGLNRTPLEIRKMLGASKGWGAYLLYLGIDELTAANLAANRILALSSHESDFDPESQFMFSTAPAWDIRAPSGKRAATVLTFTDVEEWFTFHESAVELEQQDQSKLEVVWQRIHAAMPELGDGIEAIETSTPLDCYELTRRKLGMISWPGPQAAVHSARGATFLGNLFLIGDTAGSTSSLAGVTQSALALANRITKS
jgi:phytoene dehydrogenase-like protein